MSAFYLLFLFLMNSVKRYINKVCYCYYYSDYDDDDAGATVKVTSQSWSNSIIVGYDE